MAPTYSVGAALCRVFQRDVGNIELFGDFPGWTFPDDKESIFMSKLKYHWVVLASAINKIIACPDVMFDED